ncbi:MAG: glutamyl-tRNA reductase [Candidatus Gygaella obscura]|nr:glutamyl-tRNA reductase [Candidatus Gygaella obscura]
MHIITFGLNHKSSPLSVREKFAFYEEELLRALKILHRMDFIEECLIVSTCNRVEVYAATEDIDRCLDSIKSFFLSYKGVDISDVAGNFYIFTGYEAFLHLFQVGCGLDSLVMGETQVLGQIKKSYQIAVKAQTTGKITNFLFQKAFFVSKKVRSSFPIGQHQVSIGSVSVDLINQKIDNINDKKVLVIGAGEICKTIIFSLYKENIDSIFVANRSYDKALKLNEQFKAIPIAFEGIYEYINKVDIIISSTSAPHYILDSNNFPKTIVGRKNPIMIIDLAVPRDIEPGLSSIKSVYLYNIDDLRVIIDSNRKKRLSYSEDYFSLLNKETEKFFNKLYLPQEDFINV